MGATNHSKTNNRLLLVEDDPCIQSLVKHVLKNRFSEIVSTDKISEAKEILDQNLFDLIILDLNLTDGHGEDLILHLEKRHIIQDIPIFIYSRSSVDVLNQLEKKYPIKTNLKPINPVKLLNLISVFFP